MPGARRAQRGQEQAGLEGWQSYKTARIEPQSQGRGRIAPTPALGWREDDGEEG